MNKLFKKIGFALFTIFISVSFLFIIIRLIPGSPAEIALGPLAKEDEILKFNERLGLNLPLIIQYKNYLFNMIRGNLGVSLLANKEVTELLKERVLATFSIAIISVFISTAWGIFLGVLSSLFKDSKIDKAISIAVILFLALPTFSLAPILVFLFAIKLNWLPVSEWGTYKHTILPILTLVVPLTCVILKVTRNKMLEEKKSIWITVLIAKGLSNVQITWRLIKVCLPTILTMSSIQLSAIFAGTMVIETIYDIPGMGTLLFDSITSRDYPVVQAIIIYSTIMYLVVYFLIDYINERIDPRLQS